MVKTRRHPKKSKLAPIAIYSDRALGWRDFFILFLPSCAAPLLPLFIGYWRERYALNNFGPVAVETWSQPWYQLSIVAMIPLLWLALRRVQRAHRVIKVYTKGIIIQSTWGRRWKYTWSQIQAISGVMVCYKFLGIPIKNEYQASLHPVDGKPVKLDRKISNLEELCARIKGKIYPRLLRKYRLGFQNGDSLTFGPLKFNHDQIMFKNTTLSWDQISTFEPIAGTIQVRYDGNRKIKIPVKEIPNVEIMLQIIQEGVIND